MDDVVSGALLEDDVEHDGRRLRVHLVVAAIRNPHVELSDCLVAQTPNQKNSIGGHFRMAVRLHEEDKSGVLKEAM